MGVAIGLALTQYFGFRYSTKHPEATSLINPDALLRTCRIAAEADGNGQFSKLLGFLFGGPQ